MGDITQMPSQAWSYDDVLHAYLLGSEVVPSATEVMAYTGITEDLMGKPEIVKKRIAAKARKGSRVHQATELIDTGDLDWSTLTKDEPLYVQGYQRWLREEGAIIHHREQPLIAVKDGIGPFGMKMDRIVEVRDRDWILDLKCTAQPQLVPWGVQTAAYHYGAVQRGLMRPGASRAVLWLRPKHHAEFIPITSDLSEDLDVFFHGLAIVHWKLRRAGISWMEMLSKIKMKKS